MGKYAFRWELLGDIDEGRPHLGRNVDLEMYRLMQFTLRDVIEQKCGTEEADQLFYQAGYMAGTEFYKHFIGEPASLEEFVRKAQAALKEKQVGILRIEEVLAEEGKITLTVDEDLDCSGLPEMDDEICVYDEGFVAALLEGFTKRPWSVKEIDCWCTGDRTCRFEARQQPQ